MVGAHFLENLPADAVYVFFALLPVGGHQLVDAPIFVGLEVHEGGVLELFFHPVDAQPGGNRGVDVVGLLRDLDLLGRFGVVFQGAHIVEPIRQLDEYHPQIVGHGQDHFAQAFGLTRLGTAKRQCADLGHP
jgi:hypothetical protein